MTLPRRQLRFEGDPSMQESLLDREWLVTNGRGGYASGSLSGVPTRRFHGLLIAALAAPVGRAMMLSELAETVVLPGGSRIRLGGYEHHDRPTELATFDCVREFRLEGGIPCWRFELEDADGGFFLEKRVQLVHMQNTAVVTYTLVDRAGRGRSVGIELRPFVSFRPHEGPVEGPHADAYRVAVHGADREVFGPEPFPPLRLRIEAAHAAPFVLGGESEQDVVFRVERARGYDWLGATWSPGAFQTRIDDGKEVALVASTEAWEELDALPAEAARLAERSRRRRLLQRAGFDGRATSRHPTLGFEEELILAADAFLITPGSRRGDERRAIAAGDHLRSVIAGYHWFTDWGRDTMISLEGLALTTGRWEEAGWILRTFARYVRDGLVPNMFPEGETAGLYHTADATLWFFHALDRYVSTTGDRLTLRLLLPTLRGIVDAHMRGTHFGIHVDPGDGLLSQGEEGYQLTWMDAKVDGWVVTPRRGKAVEINALWFNALTLLATWLREEGDGDASRAIGDAARRAQTSFNRRFWFEEKGYLHDVVDEPDPSETNALRPNQIFAISLPHPVLDPSRWARVVEVVERELLTPVGLRSLAPSHPSYEARYDGDLRARDAAYHQGTVWSWLIGPFIDAWLRVHPGAEGDAQRFLAGFGPHLEEACVGSISEIFDAEPPFTPRGCVAQAWSVAEVLRSLRRIQPSTTERGSYR